MDDLRNNQTNRRTRPRQNTSQLGSESFPFDKKNYTSSRHSSGKNPKKNKFKKFLKVCLVLFFLLASVSALAGGYLFWKIENTSSKIIINHNQNAPKEEKPSITQEIKSLFSDENITELRGEKDGRINILLLGRAGEGKAGTNLTDTIILMSINTQTYKVGMISLPRDMYVNIPKTNLYTKINSIYQYGLNNDKGIGPIISTVEDIVDQDIHYFVMVDFDGFTHIIDNIGGINVDVEKDIYDERYPGPNYSYETFELKKGFQHLDGATALKYARERHDDPEGDFGRAKRQQKVIQATKNKIFSLQTFLNVFTLSNLMDTLEDHVKTDIQLSDLNGFINLSKKIDMHNASNVVVDAWKKDSLLRVSHVFYGWQRVFVLVPRVGNYSEIHELTENIFDLEKLKKRQETIQSEKAVIGIVNASGNSSLSYKVKNLLNDTLNFENVKLLTSSKTKTDETQIIDYTNLSKPFSVDELIKKLPATISQNKLSNQYISQIKEPSDYDILVILGTDIIDTYIYEEGSMDDLTSIENDQTYTELLQGDKYIQEEEPKKKKKK